ncbi:MULTISPECIES: hypothetical protein [Brachybacterium]|uniref:C2H2-type domain-containing protein n=1 Tax=Brachybacterium conglomeratum TaxID=47846 RepID=A0ABQ5RHM5_9MICO|nr:MULTISPECIES: hypothetical protein [Brachybacterium]GLI30340.1 hypothetical protein BCONGLO52_11810 [Brachybacterium conglomeratum]GLK04878.1 hypothetical protein GCM10017597_16780 [Brachybacterium conglomeratum]
MSTTPEWAGGLTWPCRLCPATYADEWQRDQCEREHHEDDRDARRRHSAH